MFTGDVGPNKAVSTEGFLENYILEFQEGDRLAFDDIQRFRRIALALNKADQHHWQARSGVDNNTEKLTLDSLLEEWSVLDPGTWENDEGPKNYWAVCDHRGIIAYFHQEADAFRFRLAEINRILNG